MDDVTKIRQYFTFDTGNSCTLKILMRAGETRNSLNACYALQFITSIDIDTYS